MTPPHHTSPMAKCVCSVAAAGYQQARHNLQMSLDSFSVMAGIWQPSDHQIAPPTRLRLKLELGAIPPGALLVCVLGAVILNPACPNPDGGSLLPFWAGALA